MYHVLCIDDNAGFLFNLKASLESKYQVSTAADISEALSILIGDPVDLVLLDVNLGAEKSGISYIPEIKKIDPSVVIVMLSGHKEPSLVVEAIKMGAADYLDKLAPHEELMLVVETNVGIKQACDRHQALVEHYNEIDKNPQLIGKSPELCDLLEKATKVKGHEASILIEGESGTGKEVLARLIHSLENNPKRPFIAVNVAAIPETLIEAELFGYEKGAFTGAARRKIGKFELAHGGDLFLDEVNSLSKEFQAKLLRVLQEKEFYRVGGNESIKVTVRIISASNMDLFAETARGNFREDLFYRLRVITLNVPPLRERTEDIKPLIDHFFAKHSCDGHKKRLSPEVLTKFQLYLWPGNVRELENIIQSLIIMSPQDEVTLTDLPEYFQREDINLQKKMSEKRNDTLTHDKITQSLKEYLDQQQQYFIYHVLDQHRGNLTQAARSLKISRTTLYKKMNGEIIGHSNEN